MKDVETIKDSPIYLLGICDKFNEVVIANSTKLFPLSRKDIIGIRDFYVSQVFPLSGENFSILLILDNNNIESIKKIDKLSLSHESGKEIGFIRLSGIELSEGGPGVFSTRFTLLSTKIPGIMPLPGIYYLKLKEKSKDDILIGQFALYHQPALPLTEERIQAIKSNPMAAKYIRLEMNCNDCKDIIYIVAGIDKEKIKDSEIWYEDLPNNWECSCGKLNQDLSFIKGNLHAFLGYKPSPFSLDEEIERNYTQGALETVGNNFWKLLENKKTKEEELQKFIEKNPIILSVFSPELLKFKAPVNAKFKTDFALLNQKDELVLIEIEKATTPLFKKDGMQHSQLTHAIGQVEDWLQRATRNRLALIDDVGIKGLDINKISNIKGVVIAGRSLKEYEPYIEKLRVRKDIEFYTYDDLFQFLRRMTFQIREI